MVGTAAGNVRWDGDPRGHGIADGSWIVPDVAALQSALTEPTWVAEDPELHLLPHLSRACQADGSPWLLRGAELRDGVFEIELQWLRGGVPRRVLRAAVYGLVGEIAEGSTFVRQVGSGDPMEYHVTTGLLPGDTHFATHGHLLRLRIAENGKAIP